MSASWEKERLQRILDYHNKRHDMHIGTCDRADIIYPELKGRLGWDWVCFDEKTGMEIAVEVKRFTDKHLENRQAIIMRLLREVRTRLNLSSKLPGTFSLSVDFGRDYLQLRCDENRRALRDALNDTILESAQALSIGEKRELQPEISRRIPFDLPGFCTLQKVGQEGSTINDVSSAITGFWSPNLDKDELEEFQELVSHANEQLAQAVSAEERFLVVIDEGLRLARSATLAQAITRIDRSSYAQISWIYYVSGKEIVEIALPSA